MRENRPLLSPPSIPAYGSLAMAIDRATAAGLAVVAGYNGSEDPAAAKQSLTGSPVPLSHPDQKDYFVQRDGCRYAGTHLLIDLWGAENLDDVDVVEEALRRSALVSGATILNTDLHQFQPNGGISGVVVLSESHISIHTWPERGFAALDVFMCGDCNPYRAIDVLKEAFKPDQVTLAEQKRGLSL